MIYLVYPNDKIHVEDLIKYLHIIYGDAPVITTDIDWGPCSGLEDQITGIDISVELDIHQIFLDTGIPVFKLNGNVFAESKIKEPELSDFIPAIEHLLQDKAKEYDYDNIVDACSYANSAVPAWKAESIAFNAWRDTLWGISVEELKIALANNTAPSNEDFINGLPTYESFYELSNS
jgi:hypothetical protein